MIKNLINQHYNQLKSKHIKIDNIEVNSKSLEDLFHDALLNAMCKPEVNTLEDLSDYICQYMKINRFRDSKIESLKVNIDAYTESKEE